MNLKSDLISVPLSERLAYDPNENFFFINFEGLVIRSRETIEQIEAEVADKLSALGKKVYTIVNYDNFEISPSWWTTIPIWSSEWWNASIPG